MSIAERITKIRKEAELSQEDFADKLGIELKCVSDWEDGTTDPDAAGIKAMAEIFGTSAEYILSGKATEEQITSLDDLKFEDIFEADEFKVKIDVEPLLYDDIDKKKADVAPQPKPQKKPQPKKKAQPQKKVQPSARQRPPRRKRVVEEPTREAKIQALAIVLTACIVIVALIPLPTGGYKRLWAKFNEDPVQYPYVLVHGLAGWGGAVGINSVASYWGMMTGNIPDHLRGEGIKVYEASVGPFSSAWDRACELYAQLIGSTVDYGAAHSAEHGHDRYGKQYSTPLYPDWGKETEGGQLQKINLVGHSFGGTTIRLMTSLLEYGCEAEKLASPDDVSELFTGGKGDYINSVTTLCSPHNGSTLYYVVDQENLIPTLLGLAQATSGVTGLVADNVVDLQLEHFGIFSKDENAMKILNDSYIKGKDNAAHDLSPHGAAELNKTIQTVESVYYFSYSYCTTEKSTSSNYQVPRLSTFFAMIPFAKLIGEYTDTSESAPVKIDESWLPNDGMVNVVSARHPNDEKFVEYTEGMKIERGIWHVFPTLKGDHGTIVGMSGNAAQTHQFYIDLTAMINALPRTH